MQPAGYQTVAGWIALRTLNSQGLLHGCRCEMQFGATAPGFATSQGPDRTPELAVIWRGGPAAATVAAALTSVIDPDMPLVYDPTRRIDPEDHVVRLSAHGVPIVLISLAPNPTQRVKPIGFRAPWYWPDPMAECGVCIDHVVWHAEFDTSAEATVIRLPLDVREDMPTLEGPMVVDVDFPPARVPTELTGLRAQGEESAQIFLHRAQPGWTTADADDWLEDVMAWRTYPNACVPSIAGVVLPTELVLRWRRGWRIRVATDQPSRIPPTPWSYVPSAIYQGLACARWSRPPHTLLIQQLGQHRPHTFVLESTPALPAAI